jgi:RNA polymerase sigma-70 factor (ECF subfamily)
VSAQADRNDEQVMAAHAAADASAFPVLVQRYAGRLRALFLRHGFGEHEAQDLVQQTFLQVHRARLDYDPARPLRPWLLTIALNLARQAGRRRARAGGSLVVDPPGGEQASTEVEGREERARVRAALATLPEGQREVIELHWFQGLSFKEVAQAVGASLSAVKVRAHRGYERLRGLLGGGG